jgi:hypothetical protein
MSDISDDRQLNLFDEVSRDCADTRTQVSDEEIHTAKVLKFPDVPTTEAQKEKEILLNRILERAKLFM